MSEQTPPFSEADAAARAKSLLSGNYQPDDQKATGEYDQLYRLDASDDISSDEWLELQRAQWPILSDQQKKRFHSVQAQPALIKEPEDYSRLLDSAVELGEEKVQSSISHSPTENLRLPTEESKKQAQEFLANNRYLLDEDILKIAQCHNGSDFVRSEDLSEIVRSNSDLRLDLARYFLSKIEGHNSTKFPDRLLRNTDKSTGAYGYEEMPSRDFAILLALAVLDGSYRHGRAGADSVHIGERTLYPGIDSLASIKEKYVVRGQHRAAAALLLGLEPGTIN